MTKIIFASESKDFIGVDVVYTAGAMVEGDVVLQEQLDKLRADMAAAEKQRKQLSSKSFTLPRLRFGRKTSAQDQQPQSAAVDASNQKSQRQTATAAVCQQRVSVGVKERSKVK